MTPRPGALPGAPTRGADALCFHRRVRRRGVKGSAVEKFFINFYNFFIDSRIFLGLLLGARWEMGPAPNPQAMSEAPLGVLKFEAPGGKGDPRPPQRESVPVVRRESF